MITIQFPVLGVDDMDRAVRFWSELLGHQVREAHRTPRWCTLDPVSGDGSSLALQLSTTPVQESPRMHLDLGVHGVEEQQVEADRVCALGGSRVVWDQWPDDPDFIVVADTEGNRFCLVDLDHD
ncbi:MAG TPA: VOC family protein [Jatrophihabitantaceae bacterium]|jgi:predicted enzyme related to lactoylglutathione lyase|nr:VOC family protein [Jatrophihabitantaceae bacterium]